MIVEVALPVPIEQTFSYDVPPELASSVIPGVRVQVPFGRRTLIGVVVEISDAQPEAPLRPVETVLDDRPALTPELLDLTRWMAEYYVCGWGEAIRAALPPGGDVQPKREWHVRLTSDVRDAAGRTAATSQLRGTRQIALIESLGAAHDAGAEWVRQSDALRASGASAAVVHALEERGFVERQEREVLRGDGSGARAEPAPQHTLHPAQTAALSAITGALERSAF